MRQANVKFVGLMLVGLAVCAWGARGADSPGAKSSQDKPAAEDSTSLSRAAPRDSGDVESVYWGHLTEGQQSDAVVSLKAFAQKSADTLKHPLRLQESRDFLIYSDLTELETAHCSELLERMYAKLCGIFALDKNKSVWRGKSLVFMFARIEDYRLYERMVENDDPGDSYAMTHCFGDGMVHTAFSRFPNPAQFEHLLVHESVHGFLHRYRSPSRIPSWANEGLADEAASEVVADKPRMQILLPLTKQCLAKHENKVGDFFTEKHIDGWQYPIAETLAGWMIHQNRQGYFDFINGIKDGMTWDASLKKSFSMTPEKLLAEYGKAIGVGGIRM